jgi:hypothetical protein
MRFKLDENLPLEIADAFRDAGHEIDSVQSEASPTSGSSRQHNTPGSFCSALRAPVAAKFYDSFNRLYLISYQ